MGLIKPEATRTLPLTEVKARLSEVVRHVRRDRQSVIVTIDGEPVAEIVPARAPRRELTDNEAATARVLIHALVGARRPVERFDAVALVADGRR